MNNNGKFREEMPTQPAVERARNFKEVATGYTEIQAVAEAERCLNCKTMPCCGGCPVKVHIPQFIQAVKEGRFEDAYSIITLNNSLPAVCGRVCPQEVQCEAKCVRGLKGEAVGIGYLERFVADYHNANTDVRELNAVTNGHKVAIIGSGPSGLSCAGDLAKKGFEVTIFEALHIAGGVLVYGIPEFRLPKKIVNREIENLIAMGVKIENNVVIGKTLSIDDLFLEGFEAVFIGSGAGLPKFMNIKGENLKGVYSANEYLTRINLMKGYMENSSTPIYRARRVAVVGGGNVAMDSARSALRMGAEKVYIVYRRSEAELPARREEVVHAKEEGIEFRLLTNPKEIIGDTSGNVIGIKCSSMELGAPDSSGRRRPIEIPDSDFNLEVDCVIMSIGTSPNPLLKSTTQGLDTQKSGGIIIDENSGLTSVPYVFAGGDAVTGAATVILAMGAGKLSAENISRLLLQNDRA